MTAILAPRFLASAFASGPSLLIILALIVRKFSKFDPGREAIQKLGTIVTYALALNLFFVLVELFTGLYSDIPEHTSHFAYMFFGLHDHLTGEHFTNLVPWMWTSQILAVTAFIMMLFPKIRQKESALAALCLAIIVAIWIDKGMGMVVTGFVPSPLHKVVEYAPAGKEIMISLGIYAVGLLVLTMLYKIAISVREQLEVE